MNDNSVVIHLSKYIDQLDRRCNHNCLFCIEQMEPGMSNNILPTLFDVKKQIEGFLNIHSNIECVYVAGGEPTMHSEFIPVISYLKNICENIVLSTNCDYNNLNDMISLFKKMKINKIATSVHASSPDIHDYLTQAPGSFDRTIHTINALLSENFEVTVNYVVNSANLSDVQNTITFFESMPKSVSKLTFTHFAKHGNAYYHDELDLSFEECEKIFHSIMDKATTSKLNITFRDFPICLDQRLAEYQEYVYNIEIANVNRNGQYFFVSEKAPFFIIDKCKKCSYSELCPKFLRSNYSEVFLNGDKY